MPVSCSAAGALNIPRAPIHLGGGSRPQSAPPAHRTAVLPLPRIHPPNHAFSPSVRAYRYVSLTVTPVSDHMLLQLAAYVALLVASKMGETCPLRMKSLANLTGRMFTPLQVRAFVIFYFVP